MPAATRDGQRPGREVQIHHTAPAAPCRAGS